MERRSAFSGGNPAEYPLQSLRPLALLAMRESRATGFAVFALSEASVSNSAAEAGAKQFIPLTSHGATISSADLNRPSDESAIAAYPLRCAGYVNGVLAFVFAEPSQIAAGRAKLARIVSAIETVWRLPETAGTLIDLAERVAQLELNLADEKIASRIQGFLDAGKPEREMVEKAARHVEIVLHGGGSSALLSGTAEQLRAELEGRRVIARAKDLLRNVRGLTEEQAHLELRLASRKSRRTVRKVAEELIEEAHSSEDDHAENSAMPLWPTRYAGKVA